MKALKDMQGMELTEECLVDFDARKMSQWYLNLCLTIKRLRNESPQKEIAEAARTFFQKCKDFQKNLQERHEFVR